MGVGSRFSRTFVFLELNGVQVWLLRMWFDYAPIGTQSVQASIRIVENEKFDPYQSAHFFILLRFVN